MSQVTGPILILAVVALVLGWRALGLIERERLARLGEYGWRIASQIGKKSEERISNALVTAGVALVVAGFSAATGGVIAVRYVPEIVAAFRGDRGLGVAPQWSDWSSSESFSTTGGGGAAMFIPPNLPPGWDSANNLIVMFPYDSIGDSAYIANNYATSLGTSNAGGNGEWLFFTSTQYADPVGLDTSVIRVHHNQINPGDPDNGAGVIHVEHTNGWNEFTMWGNKGKYCDSLFMSFWWFIPEDSARENNKEYYLGHNTRPDLRNNMYIVRRPVGSEIGTGRFESNGGVIYDLDAGMTIANNLDHRNMFSSTGEDMDGVWHLLEIYYSANSDTLTSDGALHVYRDSVQVDSVGMSVGSGGDSYPATFNFKDATGMTTNDLRWFGGEVWYTSISGEQDDTIGPHNMYYAHRQIWGGGCADS